MIEARGLEPSELGRYDALNRASPEGSVWSDTAWLSYRRVPAITIGAFKGSELIASAHIPVAGGQILRYVPGTPWTGIVGRPGAGEGERLAVAEAMVDYLLQRFPEVTLTLAPEWQDVRAFTWRGMRTHVRYTYIGEHPAYEKRLRLRDCFVRVVPEHETPNWRIVGYETGDSKVTAIHDWRRVYYWQANKGGEYHAECVNTMIRDAELDGRGFDLVGCNSPQRGLFKRQFGGSLTPYYAVTTADVKDLRE